MNDRNVEGQVLLNGVLLYSHASETNVQTLPWTDDWWNAHARVEQPTQGLRPGLEDR